jgi:NAD(P)-dependent dehydrogenase (short-subunit alcohol dehydrogenase family)
MSNGDRLRDKVIIVTGAAQGIGATYARFLAAEGARIALCDIRSPDAVVAELVAGGAHAIGAVVDVTDGSAVNEFVNMTVRELGPVDVLVNNAALFGGLDKKPFMEIEADEWCKVITVNTLGTLECSKAVVRHMRKRQCGKIINIASTTVHSGTPMLLHYVASKGAVVAMTRSMARELGDYGISVNCIAPGLTSSDAVKLDATYAAVIAQSAQRRCFKREQQPEDLAGVVCFLASEDSAFITGQTIVVDGGAFML